MPSQPPVPPSPTRPDSFRPGADYGAASNGSNGYGSSQSGLLGRLLAIVQPNQNLPSNNSGSNPIGAAQFDPQDYDSPQGGLLGRLLALQSEQSRYQQGPDSHGQTAFAPKSPNVMQGPMSSEARHRVGKRRCGEFIFMRRCSTTRQQLLPPVGCKGRSIPRTRIPRTIPKPTAVRVACSADCARCKRSKASISQHLVMTGRNRTRTSDKFHPGR